MDVPQNIIKTSIQIGDVYKIPMSRLDGITPKGDDQSRNKYFIVLGFDGQGGIYGGVVINSRINQNLPRHITDYCMPISCTSYPFLKYDSFVDCSSLMTPPISKFIGVKREGVISSEDCTLIVETLKSSRQVSIIDIKRFGL